MADEKAAPKDRTASLLATRQEKMDTLFKGKKYKIAKEIHLEGDERFVTPFGHKGRNGYALVLESGEPAVIDDKKLDKFVVGETMLKEIAEKYQAVEVPVKERKRRTKEQKAADDAKAAEENAEAAKAG